MTLFNNWCDKQTDKDNEKYLWTVSEKVNGRAIIANQLYKTVRSHYDDLIRIADDIRDLGYSAAETLLKSRLPQTKKARSGDLGEILATEFTEEELDFIVPVRRLRYKDGRDMALRGDDFIGVKHSDISGLHLLKGESKSRKNLAASTITEAREVLNRDDGRCTPISLAFVADRLMDSASIELNALGKILRAETATNKLTPNRISHALITVSGNAAANLLKTDLDLADDTRTQYSINIQIVDHADFIKLIFEEVGKLGNP